MRANEIYMDNIKETKGGNPGRTSIKTNEIASASLLPRQLSNGCTEYCKDVSLRGAKGSEVGCPRFK